MGRQWNHSRYHRLLKFHDGPFPALTVLYGRRYLVDDPEFWPAWIVVGNSLARLARYEDAEQAIAKAIAFYPPEKRRLPFGQMGHVIGERGDYDGAAEWYQKGIDADPEDAGSYIYLGGVRAKQGRFQEAEDAHRAAIACSEGCIDEAYLNLGFVLRALDRYGAAAECFREAIGLDPEYRAAKQALRDVERCMTLSATPPGSAWRESTSRRSSRPRFERLRRFSHGPLTALTIRYGRRYLVDYPEHGPAWHIVGIALVELARYEEAEQAYAKALEFCPPAKRRIPLGHIGHLFHNAGDLDQAAQWYQKAIDAAPEDASSYGYLGELRAKQGRFQEAEEAHRAAIACPEGCIDEAYLNLGFVLRALDRYDEAAECFREAIGLQPGYRAAKKALRDVERCMMLNGPG